MTEQLKKILFVTAFPPNELTAGQYFSKDLINQLAEQFEIELITFSYKNHVIDVNPKVKYKIFKLNSFTKLTNSINKFYIHPIFTARFNSNWNNIIKLKAQKADYIFFDFSQVLIYDFYLNHPQKMIRLHDIIAQKYTRGSIFNKMQFLWVKLSEKYLLKYSNSIFTLSNKDAKLLDLNYKRKSIIFNGPLKPITFNLENNNINNNEFCFYGAWNRRENEMGLIWFIYKVLPSLSTNFTFKIIGPGLSKKLRLKINEFGNLKYLGFVENPLLEIFKSSGLIAPIFSGAGIKIKVLDSISVGTPVIGTDIAFEGIEVNSEICALIECKTSEEFIDAINNFNPPNLLQKISLINAIKNQYKADNITDFFK